MFFRVLFLLAFLYSASACSNIVVSPEASADSSSMVAYNADSATLFGCLYHYPAATHAPGSMRDVYVWDTGAFLGKIKEAEVTYNVVGNMNEHGLVIGETTYGGLAELQEQSKALIDYGSYIWITLQRSKTAREAVQTLGSLFKEYGWASEGESFSLADPNEAWYDVVSFVVCGFFVPILFAGSSVTLCVSSCLLHDFSNLSPFFFSGSWRSSARASTSSAPCGWPARSPRDT